MERVFEAWKQSTNRTAATVLDKKRRALITAALRLYPLEDVLDAVRGWENSPYHRGENESGIVYNDLNLLLRGAANVERFRDLARGQRLCLAVNGSNSNGHKPSAVERSWVNAMEVLQEMGG